MIAVVASVRISGVGDTNSKSLIPSPYAENWSRRFSPFIRKVITDYDGRYLPNGPSDEYAWEKDD